MNDDTATWKEVREQIDKFLAENGLTDEIEIYYLDIYKPSRDSKLLIHVRDDGTLQAE